MCDPGQKNPTLFAMPQANVPEGFSLYRGCFDPPGQHQLWRAIDAILRQAPWFQPTMPGSGRPLSVRMTNAGPLGWVSDRTGGYRYQATHPITGHAWPTIPSVLSDLWQSVASYPAPPQCCLINLYSHKKARMGLHVDGDEQDKNAPVVSVSLGDPARFRLGGLKRGDPTTSVTLYSGDVAVLGGQARHCYHGIDRIDYGKTDLIPGGGRINITLRRVTPPQP